MEIYWELPQFARSMHRLARNMRIIHFDKRGTGLSDRVSGPLDIGVRMDDIRAVMDAAGRGAGSPLRVGYGGTPLAAVFGSTYPERTLALLIDEDISMRRTEDYPWGMTEEEHDAIIAATVARWGEEEGIPDLVNWVFGEDPASSRPLDTAYMTWTAKFSRYAETPASYEAFQRMWLRPTCATCCLRCTCRPPCSTRPMIPIPRTETGRPTPQSAYRGPSWWRYPVWRMCPGLEEPEPLVSAIEHFLDSVREEEADSTACWPPSCSPTS